VATIRFDVNDVELRDAFLRHVLLDALAPLSDTCKPRWGRMTSQQMVEHLTWAFELSTGQAHTDCPVPDAERERMKAFLHHNRPTPHEFMNPALVAGLPPLRHAGLAEARTALRVAVDRFLAQPDVTPGVVHTHPLFGPIGVEEWARAHFKHGYHHLLQFGLVNGEE
jgi:oxepin-CoA hydrolase/3-oxo-5,6-dehydrosuberyl-CoA semialdehyde dehydrogenase